MKENCIRLNGGLHNDVFHLVNEGKVERHSDTRKTKEMVLQEIEWMNFLYEKGVNVPKSEIPFKNEENRIIAHFEFVKGEQIDVTNQSHWNVKTFEELGRILGRMHALAKEFMVSEVHRPVWTVENPDVFDVRGSLSDWMRDCYDQLLENLYPFEIIPDTYGLIHNDFHQGNLILKDDESITTIDFDECAYNWFGQDIAVVFYHAYWQHDSFTGKSGDFSTTFMSHLFKGYEEENILHKDMIKQIPIFLKLREIFLFQLFMKKWNMNALEEWQRYTLVDLEKKIKNKIAYAGISDYSVFLKS